MESDQFSGRWKVISDEDAIRGARKEGRDQYIARTVSI